MKPFNIKYIAAVTLSVFAGAAATPGLVSAEELSVAHFVSPNHPMDRLVIRPLTEDIAETSDGALTMRIYPAGELGAGPAQQYKRVMTGVADVVFGIPSFTPDQFPRMGLVEIPGKFDSAEAATQAIWDNLGVFDVEFEGTKVLALWSNNPAVLISREKPVRTLEDIAGMKIRTPNPIAAELVEGWGGIPVSMPPTAVYNSMSTGVIDAVIMGPSGIGSFKLNETAAYITTNIPSSVDTFYLLMNQNSWDGLNVEEQAYLDAVTGLELSLSAASAYESVGLAGLELARETGLEIIELEQDQLEKFEAVAGAITDGILVAKTAQIGEDAAGISGQLSNE